MAKAYRITLRNLRSYQELNVPFTYVVRGRTISLGEPNDLAAWGNLPERHRNFIEVMISGYLDGIMQSDSFVAWDFEPSGQTISEAVVGA